MPLSNVLDRIKSVTACGNIRRFLNEARHITRSNAQSWFASAVCCLHHRMIRQLPERARHRDDSSAAVLLPQKDTSIHWMQCSGAPCLHCSLQQSLCSRCTALLCGWMEAEDDRITRFHRRSSDLNIVVEVGFVTGVTPAIMPTGSAPF